MFAVRLRGRGRFPPVATEVEENRMVIFRFEEIAELKSFCEASFAETSSSATRCSWGMCRPFGRSGWHGEIVGAILTVKSVFF